MCRLKRLLRKCKFLDMYFQNICCDSFYRVSSHLNPTYLFALAFSLSWPDSFVARDVCAGHAVVGELPEFGIFRKADVQAVLGINDLKLSNEEWNTSCLRRPPPPAEEAEVIWRKSCEEKDRGLIEGWYSAKDLDEMFGANNWRAMVRFAIYQEAHRSWRCIDNGKSNRLNDCVTMLERIHTTTPEVGYNIARHFRWRLGPLRGRRALRAAARDLKSAYRQFCVKPSDLPFSIIVVWDIERKRWCFGILHALAFGESSAVLQFNRHPCLLTALARRWFAIPVCHYFDDFRLMDPVFANESGTDTFDYLSQLLGYRFDPDKSTSLSMDGVFLGGAESLAMQHLDIISVSPEAQRLERLLRDLRRFLDSQALTVKGARSTRGRVQAMCRYTVGRVGRGCLHALSHYETAQSPLPPEIVDELDFHLRLLSLGLWRTIPISPAMRCEATMYTDASCEPEGTGLRVACCWWLVADGCRRGGVLVLPQRVKDAFRGHKTLITQGEAFAPLFALWFMSEHVIDTDILLFVDNLDVVSALCGGGSSNFNIGGIIHATNFALARLRASLWTEHVQSKSNCSDGGSREAGVRCHIAAQCGVDLRTYEYPSSWPSDMRRLDVSLWLSILSSVGHFGVASQSG